MTKLTLNSNQLINKIRCNFVLISKVIVSLLTFSHLREERSQYVVPPNIIAKLSFNPYVKLHKHLVRPLFIENCHVPHLCKSYFQAHIHGK